ncbi:MAG: L-aspartate oxidase [Pirellulales bacterium]
MSSYPRYLVPFHPKQIPHQFVDVLIIGGGIAGLRAALEIDPQLSVLVVTKDRLKESNSNYAQGGIASVLNSCDDFDQHLADTLTAGAGLCDREVVEMVVREAPQHIDQLVAWGTQFDREPPGNLQMGNLQTGDHQAGESLGEFVLGREGGHSQFRIVHALGDATGKEVMRAMIERVHQEPNRQIWRHTFTIDLLTCDNVCRGALVWNQHHGKTFLWAKQTVLCTGGSGQLYRETTNSAVATGDGHAIAYRAGVELADMEFMQFHPTVLYIAGSSRSLISEAMRGEGALLVDCHGHRFMPEHDPRAELAPRDIVSQAIVEEMEKTRHPCVYLDLSHLEADWVRRRFPSITRRCQEFGLDITTDRVPVRPGAHYIVGGVTIDPQGQTTLPGLWAAGEATSSGLHGANRLASNSLLEGLVYGAHAGAGASAAALSQPDSYQAIPLENKPTSPHEERLDLLDVRNSLRSLMWRQVGVRRSGEQLHLASTTVDTWCRYALDRQFTDPTGWELQNMLTIAQVVIGAALEREESRGVHFRHDFPCQGDSRWQKRLATSRLAAGEYRELG